MSSKTLTEMRSMVLAYYGDVDGITADASGTSTEVDLFLKAGVNFLLSRCPWLYVTVPATHNLTTDAVGAALFDDENIGQSWSIEVQETSGDYRLLQPGHASRFSDPEYIVATTVDEIHEYVLDGNRIQFYPVYKSGNVTIRTTFASNSIGSAFPTSGSNTLPNSIPIQGEEVAILYAVQKLHERDNNFEAAGFIKGDIESRLMMLKAEHNRPQRGRNMVIYNEDEYVLDASDDAW